MGVNQFIDLDHCFALYAPISLGLLNGGTPCSEICQNKFYETKSELN